MSEQENIRVVQQAYETFQRGDIQKLLEHFSEDISWQLPESDTLPFAGKRQGRDQVRQFFALLADAQDIKEFEPKEYIAQGNKVVALGHYVWKVKSTGREYYSDWAHVWTVENGKLKALHEFTDLAAANRAHQKAQTA